MKYLLNHLLYLTMIICQITACSKSTEPKPSTPPDKGSYALHFDGLNGFISTSKKYTDPSEFTLELWFNTTTDSGGKLIGFEDLITGSSDQWDRQIYMDNDGKIHFGVYPLYQVILSTTEPFNDGQWHHVAASISDLGMFLYLDGNLIRNNPNETDCEEYDGYWRIGGGNLNWWQSEPTSYYFEGFIDEVRIWNIARSHSDIQQDMGREISSDEAGLCNYWKFNAGSGNMVYDWVYENDGSIVGNVDWIVSTAPIQK